MISRGQFRLIRKTIPARKSLLGLVRINLARTLELPLLVKSVGVFLFTHLNQGLKGNLFFFSPLNLKGNSGRLASFLIIQVFPVDLHRLQALSLTDRVALRCLARLRSKELGRYRGDPRQQVRLLRKEI